MTTRLLDFPDSPAALAPNCRLARLLQKAASAQETRLQAQHEVTAAEAELRAASAEVARMAQSRTATALQIAEAGLTARRRERAVQEARARALVALDVERQHWGEWSREWSGYLRLLGDWREHGHAWSSGKQAATLARLERLTAPAE